VEPNFVELDAALEEVNIEVGCTKDRVGSKHVRNRKRGRRKIDVFIAIGRGLCFVFGFFILLLLNLESVLVGIFYSNRSSSFCDKLLTRKEENVMIWYM